MSKSLLNLAEKKYRLKIHKHSFIHDTEKTKVLALETNRGKFILKTLYKPVERQLFILAAEEHFRKNSIRVPKTIPTKEKKLYFIWRGYPYVLQEWITGSSYPLKNTERIKRVGSILGKIHRASLGFRSSMGNSYDGSSKWKDTYNEALRYMRDWKARYCHSKNVKLVSIVKNIDYFIEAGEKVAELCIDYPYFAKWRSLPLHQHYLCHGDFHTSNLLVTDSKYFVIDWEDVRYDFPSKDFTRMISFMMKTRYPEWSNKRFEMMYSAYLKKNPLSYEEQGLFFHDMAFPHIFVRYLRKELYRGMSKNKVREFIIGERDKYEYMIKRVRPFANNT